jgi:hypothetical protein
MALTLDQAKQALEGTTRHELRDHAFGDMEVTWVKKEDNHEVEVASGYFGGTASVGFLDPDPSKSSGSFVDDDARQLLQCGELEVERNDSVGPDKFVEGSCMPGLTLQGVRKELTQG